MGRKIRRVVTGHDENGVATVIMDGMLTVFYSVPIVPA